MIERELAFWLRDRPGRISIRVEPNRDPDDLGHPLVAVGYDREAFLGFPVIEARVHYDGRGPRAWMGWLQVVQRVDDDGTVELDVDTPPLWAQESPLYTFGYAPTFSDFPANPDHPDGTWNAHTFLVAVPDVARSRVLEPVAGFRWGYRLLGGRPVEIFEPAAQAMDTWDGLRDLLGRQYPTWSFLPAQS